MQACPGGTWGEAGVSAVKKALCWHLAARYSVIQCGGKVFCQSYPYSEGWASNYNDVSTCERRGGYIWTGEGDDIEMCS